MKKILYFTAIAGFMALTFSSCSKDDDFDESMLVGTWQQDNTEYFERYQANGNGYTWDEGDGVYESEAQPFTWTLDDADLTQIHIMEIGGNVPRFYTITELTSTRLKYEGHNLKYSFRKVR